MYSCLILDCYFSPVTRLTYPGKKLEKDTFERDISNLNKEIDKKHPCRLLTRNIKMFMYIIMVNQIEICNCFFQEVIEGKNMMKFQQNETVETLSVSINLAYASYMKSPNFIQNNIYLFLPKPGLKQHEQVSCSNSRTTISRSTVHR